MKTEIDYSQSENPLVDAWKDSSNYMNSSLFDEGLEAKVLEIAKSLTVLQLANALSMFVGIEGDIPVQAIWNMANHGHPEGEQNGD